MEYDTITVINKRPYIFSFEQVLSFMMALGSIQPLDRNEFQEHFLGVKAVGA